MLVVVMLVCSSALSPTECQRETALDVITGPHVASVGECGLVGQTTIASTALAGQATGTYLKIRCEPLRAVTSTEKF